MGVNSSNHYLSTGEATLHFHRLLRNSGAGEGNRTLVVSLEGFCSTIELHPPCADPNQHSCANCNTPHGLATPPGQMGTGGGGWIRTNVGVSQQIYSLPPLATRAPLREEPAIMEFA
jgi:hypothetical protein